MNPITIIGAIGAVAVLTYTHSVAYQAGKHEVQAAWNKDVTTRSKELSVYKDRLIVLERSLSVSQKEAQDARLREDEANAKALAAHRSGAASADRRLRDANAELAKRLAAHANDSAALTECKAAGAGYRSVFDQCVQEYRQLGDRAQVRLADAVAAGLECERSYDNAERALRAFTVP